MSEFNDYQKYLKYKVKYNNLKAQIEMDGGLPSMSLFNSPIENEYNFIKALDTELLKKELINLNDEISAINININEQIQLVTDFISKHNTYPIKNDILTILQTKTKTSNPKINKFLLNHEKFFDSIIKMVNQKIKANHTYSETTTKLTNIIKIDKEKQKKEVALQIAKDEVTDANSQIINIQSKYNEDLKKAQDNYKTTLDDYCNHNKYSDKSTCATYIASDLANSTSTRIKKELDKISIPKISIPNISIPKISMFGKLKY